MTQILLALCLLLTSACSVDVGDSVRGITSQIDGECGWYQDPGNPWAPQSECHIYVATPGAGMLAEGDDPCDVTPQHEMLVHAGHSHTEWHRFSQDYQVTEMPCQ